MLEQGMSAESFWGGSEDLTIRAKKRRRKKKRSSSQDIIFGGRRATVDYYDVESVNGRPEPASAKHGPAEKVNGQKAELNDEIKRVMQMRFDGWDASIDEEQKNAKARFAAEKFGDHFQYKRDDARISEQQARVDDWKKGREEGRVEKLSNERAQWMAKKAPENTPERTVEISRNKFGAVIPIQRAAPKNSTEKPEKPRRAKSNRPRRAQSGLHDAVLDYIDGQSGSNSA